MKVKVLRDYLENVRMLESDIYTFEQTIDRLNRAKKAKPERSKHIPLQNPDYAASLKKPEAPDVNTKVKWWLWIIAIYAGFGVGAVPFALHEYVDWIAADVAEFLVLLSTLLVAAIVCCGPVVLIICKIRKTQLAKKKQREYENALKRYHAECDRLYKLEIGKAQKEYQKSYQIQCEQAEAYNQNLDAQIQIVKNQLDATRAALQKLYGLNIVYRKYQSFIPICMFCEYIDSGRRSELTGKDGMYELYEQELVGNLIIGELTGINRNLKNISAQLSNISSQLTGIQRSQMLVYEEVARGNSAAAEITNKTCSMLEAVDCRLSSVQSSTELTALNTAAAARRTDAIARIAEYEYAKTHSSYIW